MKQHFLYRTTCTPTGRFYVGMHSGTIRDNYLGSGLVLKSSVKKYGKNAHVREVIGIFETREALIQAEVELITDEMLANPLCMNIRAGGQGGFKRHTDTARQKQREAAAKRPASHYVRGEKHGMFGKTHTPEARASIAAACRARTGTKMSDEARKRMSESKKAFYARKKLETV